MLGDVLQFKGTWRTYQQRVLDSANKYLADGRIHIVAAPGSGKTTLGIELIRRLGEPALVLTPSITIREQWVQRIEEAFLKEGLIAEEYLSQSLKNPKPITVVTYQSLHSAMNHFKGTEIEEREALEGEQKLTEEVDYTGFDVIKIMKGVGVICLDECHHLRSEWWKALEEFKERIGQLKTIALTATPPYDDSPAMWNRYMNMCGEIDEEITVPELVKEGSLCPHQDFVYFNYPTQEEKDKIHEFVKKASMTVQELMADDMFAKAVSSHNMFLGKANMDEMLENPAYVSSLLIFMNEKHMPVPQRLKMLMGVKDLPKMEPKWMEYLLQGMLYEDSESYGIDKEYIAQLTSLLKTRGLIDKKKVVLQTNVNIEKMLTNSLGKINSIKEIVFNEYESMGEELRLLILTDFIRKEYEKNIGKPETDVNACGVLPFFEMLRRESIARGKEISLGVLCGTVVIIPAKAKEMLEKEISGIGNVTYSSFGLFPQDYLKVTAVGDAHFLTGAITNIYTKGAMQILIGTKSLLGEGWDSPCINSLILASFVGSFMLSNQMRGRAIRVFRDKPKKTSNIWHLVCLNDTKEESEDYSLLKRRLEHFLGLHYTENVIENGMERMSIIKEPFDAAKVEQMNTEMLALSRQRESLESRWKNSLSLHRKLEIIDEVEVAEPCLSTCVFKDALRGTVVAILICALIILGLGGLLFSKATTIVCFILALALIFMLRYLPKILSVGTPFRILQSFGKGINRALSMKRMYEVKNCRVKAKNSKAMSYQIYLQGGSGKDKKLFSDCVKEMFAPIDNQRYILERRKKIKGKMGYFAIPDVFSKNKEDALLFAKCMTPYIGNYDVVYTRNEEGRKTLMSARMKAFANVSDRVVNRKKVKSPLE